MITDAILKKLLEDTGEYQMRTSPHFTQAVVKRVWIKKLLPWFAVVSVSVLLSLLIFVIEIMKSGIFHSLADILSDFDFSWEFVSFIPQYFDSLQVYSFVIIMCSLFFLLFSLRLFTKTVYPWIKSVMH